jgi:hypothetical protein
MSELLLQEVSRSVQSIDKRLAALDVHIDGIVKPPTLEQRLIAYIDGRDSHNKNNFLETLGMVKSSLEQSQHIAKLELELKISESKQVALQALAQTEATEKTRATDHADNIKLQEGYGKLQEGYESANALRHEKTEKKVDWMMNRIWFALGAIALAQGGIVIMLKMMK